MKIVNLVGARPQFIKAATVSRCLAEQQGVKEYLINSGQHYDKNMAAIFFDELSLAKPERDLGVGSGPHGEQTAKIMMALEQAMVEIKPDKVLIYGDTNTTLAGALVAAKLHIPLAHVEAGLRSFNRKMPEEVNRVVADHTSDLLFCPTELAVNNAKAEGIADEKIHNVGDVMYDVALFYRQQAQGLAETLLAKHKLQSRHYILSTIHRAENTDDADILTSLFTQLNQLASQYPVILPLHPRTKHALLKNNQLDKLTSNIIITEPVSFLEMIALESHASLIITDSGGVQKEAYFYRVPCLTVREQTEWVELINHGWNRLVCVKEFDALPELALSQITSQGADVDLYGGGQASQRIVDVLLNS